MEKICKFCAMKIPEAAKICPFCRKSQPQPVKWWQVILFLFLGWLAYSWASMSSTINPYQHKSSGAITAKDDLGERVSIKVSKFYEESGYIKIAGYIKNDNDVPLGVKVKFTCYDKKNEVAKVNESWPASVRNIPAHSKYTFETIFEGYPGIVRLESEIIETRTW